MSELLHITTENTQAVTINRGTGAGGANTNVTGLGFERVTDMGEIENSIRFQFENESERCGHPISWENQGEWHIDHIRPCASFNLDLEEERHKCFHYTNLQPMWCPDNISKSDTYDEDEDEREWDGDKWIKK